MSAPACTCGLAYDPTLGHLWDCPLAGPDDVAAAVRAYVDRLPRRVPPPAPDDPART